jgi:hypothetical protein
MKIPFRYKISFALFSGLVFALLNSLITYFFLEEDISISRFVFNLIFFGFVFGFGYLFLMKRLTDKLMQKINIDLNEDETEQYEGPANLFRGIEGVGGKLLLTDKRLIFKSHQLNIQSGETQYLLKDIKEVVPRKTAKLFQNGIRVVTESGENLDFVLYERDFWVSKIKEQLRAV